MGRTPSTHGKHENTQVSAKNHEKRPFGRHVHNVYGQIILKFVLKEQVVKM
jgi:hypothetical protein